MSRGGGNGGGEDASDTGPWLEAGEAEARLLLFAPPVAEVPDPASLAPALLAARPAALVVDAGGVPEADRVDRIGRWRGLAREAGTALLLADDPILVINAGADGVHLADPRRLEPARRLLGPERLIGCACGLSRHAAMEAGEAGADYVLFGEPGRPDDEDATVELVAWWAELFVLPCAAAAARPEPTAIAALARAGADFVAVGGGALREPAGDAAARLSALRAALVSASA